MNLKLLLLKLWTMVPFEGIDVSGIEWLASPAFPINTVSIAIGTASSASGGNATATIAAAPLRTDFVILLFVSMSFSFIFIGLLVLFMLFVSPQHAAKGGW
ncbi:MAG: hypothetical protein LBD14_06245 [Puniceicoccales bacterium]|nr:hypothetical protein [Puniceicoccales bacterium]